jgi:fructan beta-fructosidase
MNPGGPNKGSGTQYFLGDFDGNKFSPYSTETKWIDYGPDDYAGVTWSNTGKRKLFLGWMSNWNYATVVPTETWRSAMTIPRELRIVKIGDEMFVASTIVKEIASIRTKPIIANNVSLSKPFDVASIAGDIKFPCLLDLSIDSIKDVSITLSNDLDEKLVIGYDKQHDQYFVDRTSSGDTSFHTEFAGKHTAPRLTNISKMDISLLIDASSVELFADAGLTSMTEIFFPTKPYTKIRIGSTDEAIIKKLEFVSLKSIWK